MCGVQFQWSNTTVKWEKGGEGRRREGRKEGKEEREGEGKKGESEKMGRVKASQQEGIRSEMWYLQLSGAAGGCYSWDGSQPALGRLQGVVLYSILSRAPKR